MNTRFRDHEHLLRMAGVFAAGVLVFLALRGILVPADFGLFGHFRAGALDDLREAPLVYAGREACEACHDDVAEVRHAGRHRGVGCEACHGPLARHANDPEALEPTLPESTRLCPTCHASNTARPASFPQVEPEEHADGEACVECHDPHAPEVE